MSQLTVEILGARCIRCAACATVAPALFRVAAGPAKVLRQPADDAERLRALAAIRLCPTSALREAAR